MAVRPETPGAGNGAVTGRTRAAGLETSIACTSVTADRVRSENALSVNLRGSEQDDRDGDNRNEYVTLCEFQNLAPILVRVL